MDRGEAAVLSEIAGFRDRGLLRHGKYCDLIKLGEAEALGRSIRNMSRWRCRCTKYRPGRAVRRADYLDLDA